MFKRILVPTDASEAAAAGVRYAVAFASLQHASLVVLHVVDIKLLEGPFLRDLSASLGAAPYVNYQGNIAMLLDERGKAALNYAEGLCKAQGIPCETCLVTGIVPRVICEKASLVDLIIMGRTGEHNQFLEGLAGSTTEAVVRRAGIPVLVTAWDTPACNRILLAYDGSKHAKKAVKITADWAENRSNQILCLTIDDSLESTLLDEVKQYLSSRQVNISYEIRKGIAGEEIVSFAKECDADMIVMGAYGHSKLRELVLGSTTSYVINHAGCPALLVR